MSTTKQHRAAAPLELRVAIDQSATPQGIDDLAAGCFGERLQIDRSAPIVTCRRGGLQ
jgi:hypothetical protein